jgi:amino acid adenylation domain-containing protein
METSIVNLLSTLRQRGVGLGLDVTGANLKLSGQLAQLSSEDKTTLKRRKPEIIAFLQASLRKKEEGRFSIERAPQSESYPMSDGQFRLWILSQYNEAAKSLNIPKAFRLKGDIAAEQLEKAVQHVIAQHDILRTAYKETANGDVHQFITPIADTAFKLVVEPIAEEEGFEEAMSQETNWVFDLTTAPLIRFRLLKIQNGEHVFMLNMHHSIGDGWSIELLGQQIFQAYARLILSAPLAVNESLQYKDFAVWQRGNSEDQAFKDARSFWLDQFSTPVQPINIHGDSERPVVKTYNGAESTFQISAKDANAFKIFCQAKQASPYVGLLLSLHILLNRYTGQNDHVVASSVAGRPFQQLEDVIGFFVNVLPFRLEFKEGETISEVLQRLQRTVMKGMKHQLFPFDRLVQELKPPMDTSRSPLFDVMLTFHNQGSAAGSKQESIAGIEIETVSLEIPYAKYDLDFHFVEYDGGFSGVLVYNKDIYGASQIAQLVADFCHVVKQLPTTASLTPNDPAFLNPAQYDIQPATSSAVDTTSTETLVQQFETQVQQSPSAVAVEFGRITLTYSELDERANAISNHLIAASAVNPEDIVAIALERSEWVPAVLLGILKAGAAYLPIDPSYPDARKEFILAESGALLCMDQAWLDELLAARESWSISSPTVSIAGENLAYVIYTSGSSGTPKGVMVEHRNVISFFKNLETKLGFKSITKVAGTTAFTFDISVLEVFGALCSGRTLVLFSDEEVLDPFSFMEALEQHAVQLLQLTPSRLKQLLSVLSKMPSSLQVMLVGGEAFPEQAQTVLRGYPNLKMINVYGPTETTIWTTAKQVSAERAVTLGSPLQEEAICILDAYGNLVPKGGIGEICIAGGGVSRGYLNRETLTNSVFIAHPIVAAARLYKTGDFGRWNSSNELVFHGRKDSQHKFRGYRIELGEIESAIETNDEVDAAKVLVQHDAHDNESLTAFVAGSSVLRDDVIRDQLSRQLPMYMVPSVWNIMDELPTNSSGKTDVKALRMLQTKAVGPSDAIAPRNEYEEEVMSLWKQVLPELSFGIRANFFEVGGNSLNIVQLFQLYKSKGAGPSSIVDLYQHVTIEAQANLLDIEPIGSEFAVAEDVIELDF